jgi:hypothetical protein
MIKKVFPNSLARFSTRGKPQGAALLAAAALLSQLLHLYIIPATKLSNGRWSRRCCWILVVWGMPIRRQLPGRSQSSKGMPAKD